MNKDKSFSKRSALVFAFEVLLIVIAIGGLTFATSSMLGGSSTIVTFGEYNVDYLGETEIIANDMEPISDSLINYNTTDNVMRLEFSLRGVDTNENPERLIYDVMVTDLDIDCSLLNKYTKWNLYKNGELIYNGNFSPEFDGNVLTDNFRLTETQQKLPLHTEEYDDYVLLIWISESCDDLTTCELVDQSDTVNSKINMKVFIALSGGESVIYERVPNTNYTCVNKPLLYDGMVPIYFDNGSIKIADKNNGNEYHKWYDYGDSRWANVAVVNTLKYKDSSSGTVIDMSDVQGIYTWIPRFKYKLLDSYEKGFDIVFESGVNSTGNMTCILGNCIVQNNKYLTHPSFSNNLRGFWISKYEISEGVKFIPNVSSLNNKALDEYKTMIEGLSVAYNLSDNIDSHIVSNLEWGATLYLSHSKYGLCDANECKKLDNVNNYMVHGMDNDVAEYTVEMDSVFSSILGRALAETENLYNYIKNNDYVIRGNNTEEVTARSVLISK